MEKYQKHGINPLLISIATGQDVANVSPRPTVTMLPCKYSKLVYKHFKTVNSEFPENIFRLSCKHCGKSGDYDLATLVFPVANTEDESQKKKFQALGYFRCKHCNAAGEWDLAPRTQALVLGKMAAAAVNKATGNDVDDGVVFGNAIIDNIFMPRWGSDAEDYFLKKLAHSPDNAYFWNRLGNAYYRGKRPELAVFAHGQAVLRDAGQVESHFSLGKILLECGELAKASEHLRQAVAFSHQYKYLTAYDLRELIVSALEILLTIYNQSGKKIDVLPKPDETAMSSLVQSQIAATASMDFEIDASRRDTLYPLAEVYLGERQHELPAEERTLRRKTKRADWPLAKRVNKQKPPRKNKKGKRK